MRVPGAAAVGRWLRSVRPERASVRADAVAGLPGAISSVPDGMAAAVLAGVSPVHGLYASTVGPVAGGLTTSTKLMVVTTTTASALAAGSAVSGVPEHDRAAALLLVSVLAGGLMVAAGLARLGRYTRFVSHSVMIGFLSGVAVNIVLGQLPDLTGTVDPRGAISLTKGLDVLLHPGHWNLPSLLAGLGALGVMVALARTRLASVSALVALALPTVTCALLDASSVLRVSDSGAIPRGLPSPALPELALLDLSIVGGAIAIAAIVLVQGAGVAEAAPNPDGVPTRTNVDFIAQGVGNLVSGAFRGMPVGGSIGQTALNRAAGARTRWGTIWAGIWMLVTIAVFSPIVGQVLLPTLAAVLVYAAAGALRPHEAVMVLRTGTISRIAILSTFAATLFLPVAAAVGLGVVISLLLQVNREALDLAVVELVLDDDGKIVERPAPARLPDHAVTVLDVYGSLFYAGAKTLEARLPSATSSPGAVVVLRLRGRTVLGATSFLVIARYADHLHDSGGRLYLSGVDPALLQQFSRSGRRPVDGPVRLYEATRIVGGSSRAAFADAEAWLVRHSADTTGGTEP